MKRPTAAAPDGGWGWMIVASCFLTTICTRAVTRCISIFFVEFQLQFSRDYSGTAWIHSIVDSMTMLCAPLGSFIGNRLSHRAAVMLGGMLSVTGLVLSSFATSLEFLYLSLGIVTGMGFALSYTPAVAMVGMYFSKRKALAYGLAMSGSGIGTFVLAPVVQLLIEHYSWRGALLILGGLVSHLCVCAALLKPVEEQELGADELEKGCVVSLPDAKQGDAKLTHVKLPDLKLADGKPVGEILKEFKQAGDVPGYTKRPDWRSAEGTHLTMEKSDIMCFLPKHLETNQEKTACVNEQLSDTKSVTQNPPNTDVEHTESMHVIKEKSDNMCSSPMQLETNQENTAEANTQPTVTKLETQDPPNTESEQTESIHVINEKWDNVCLSPKHSETNQVEEENTRHANTEPLTQYPPGTEVKLSKPVDPTPLDSTLTALKPADAKLCDLELHCAKLVEAKLREKNWSSPGAPVTTGWSSWCRVVAGCRFCLPPTEEYGFLLMTDFLLLSMSFLFLAYGCSVPFVYLVPYALSVGVSHQQAALLISVMGVISIMGNITFGWITDWSCLRPYRMVSYMLAVGLEGFSCFLVPLLQSFPLLVPFALLYGYFDGAYVALIPVVTSDIVGSSYLSSALGVVYFLHAIPYLISPPIGGWLVDRTGSYMTTFLLSGFSIMCSSVVLGFMCLLRHCCRGHSGSSGDGSSQPDLMKPALHQDPRSQHPLKAHHALLSSSCTAEMLQ
ncbi:monocarboxylate transporter 12-B-like [Alosa sapidissima]|uniref:monocarboxylate transporter 12-B-like n=1 Tax=Alosa sapidissima TaxID=34773 RepID=UPI001C0A306D|nr:monocarboxylate transporter 12-B-like [Alosa sapidissima]XP_041920752.1 monocarboxylate transporter 12-B-like [Alosa sapidissima]